MILKLRLNDLEIIILQIPLLQIVFDNMHIHVDHDIAKHAVMIIERNNMHTCSCNLVNLS